MERSCKGNFQRLRRSLRSFISRKHTYVAGFTDNAVGVAVEGPLCNTGIIITVNEVSSNQAALTMQVRRAVQMFPEGVKM